MQSHCLIDTASKKWELLDMLEGRDIRICRNCSVQLGAKARYNGSRGFALIIEDPVEYGTRCVTDRIAASDKFYESL